MNAGFNIITENLGISLHTIILIAINIGNIIFAAKDFKLFAVMGFLTNGLLFMWFYSAGYDYTFAVVAFFMYLIILSLSLYFVSQSVDRGSVI